MFKRIITGILAFAIAAFALCGCSFFTHDYERDMQQEIAVVKSYDIVNAVLEETDETDDKGDKIVQSKQYTYTTKAKTIYKQDLVDYVNSNAGSLSSSFANLESLYNYAVRMLVSVELVTNEVDALIECGKVEWGIEQENSVRKSLYNIIDNTLVSLKNTILDERDEEQIITDNSSSATSGTETTYPVKPDETDDADDDNDFEPEPWEPSRSMWPGVNGNDDQRSLDREAMRRFIALIKSRVKDDFRLNKSDRAWLKAKIDNEIKAIDRVIDTQGIEYVYPVIASYSYPMNEYDGEFGYMLYYLSGESLERSQKITAMQDSLEDGVSVSYDEVAAKYRTTLSEQQKLYEEDITSYNTDMNGSSTTVLYHPVVNYFYVKHILLPFSDEQKEALHAFENRSDIKNLQEDEKKAKIEEYRARLAEAIVCYPHKNGEDDLTRPMSVDDVMNHIRSVMTAKKANKKAANDAFNDLIYLYNTDPGAFGNDTGYIVKYKLDENESETYMQEFADAARYMFENIEVGEVYYEKVITDYGVHIMYLSSVVKKGAVGLNDTTSPSGTETYYDLLEAPIKSNRASAAYNTWENNILSYNYKKYSEIYTDIFSDLWEKK